MEENKQHLETLQEIRQIMKQSNRFLSLSGLSGVSAGVYALLGTYLGNLAINSFIDDVRAGENREQVYIRLLVRCFIIGAAILGLSLVTALYFSWRKAKKNNQKLFDHTTWRLMINMLIPLCAGGFFCIAMLYHGNDHVLLISPAMLIFYGLALVNGSKYTLHDIRYLGCLEILLGLVACFFPGSSLLFWALGFGVLHIVYGTFMWFKYERNN